MWSNTKYWSDLTSWLLIISFFFPSEKNTVTIIKLEHPLCFNSSILHRCTRHRHDFEPNFNFGWRENSFFSSLQIICTNQYRFSFIRSTLNFSDVLDQVVLHWISFLPYYKKKENFKTSKKVSFEHRYWTNRLHFHTFLVHNPFKILDYQIHDWQISEIRFGLNNCPTNLVKLQNTQ